MISHEKTINTPDDFASVVRFVKSNAKALAENGTPLRIIITTTEQKRHAQQNAFLWSAVYRDIANQVWAGGRQFSSETWHELYARMFLPLVDVVLPTGEVIQRRTSTTELGVKAFAEYVTQVQAHAAQEYGVRFSAL